jgi:hypothetical protein
MMIVVDSYLGEYDFNSITKAGTDDRSRGKNGSIRFANEVYDWVRMTGSNPMPTLPGPADETVTSGRGN